MKISVVTIAVVCTLLAATGIGCDGAQSEFELTLIVGGEPKTLDPGKIQSLNASRIADSLFEGLTNLNIDNPLEPLPGLADHWETSDDGLTSIFHLREALWSNGEPIRASDFVYSWRRVLTQSNGFPYADFLFYLKNGEAFYNGTVAFDQVGVHAPNEKTLVVTLEKKAPQFLELTSFTTFRPVYPPGVEEHGAQWTRPETMVCSGPYTLEAWRVNHRIVLRKNERYWDVPNVRTGSVAFLVEYSPNTSLNLYEAGHADFITSVPSATLNALEARDDFHAAQTLGTYFIRFNTTRPPFDDPRVRQALSMAIDREALTEYVTQGGTEPAYGFVPTTMPGYDAIKGLHYDPDAARRLLAEAGYPDGKGFPRFTYLYNASDSNAEVAQVLQSDWARLLTINVELEQAEWKVYLDRLSKHNYDFARGSWYGDYLVPSTYLDMFTSGNRFNQTGWSNAEYDRLVTEANQMLDPARRTATYLQAERILVEQAAPIAPVYYFASTNLYKPWVKGMVPNVRNTIRIKDLWVDQTIKAGASR